MPQRAEASLTVTEELGLHGRYPGLCVIKSELHASEHVETWKNLSAPWGWSILPHPPPLNVTLDYWRQDVATEGTG